MVLGGANDRKFTYFLYNKRYTGYRDRKMMTIKFSNGHNESLNSPDQVQRVFVVGCGHSGTSLLLRTIGNFRNVRCLEKETSLFIRSFTNHWIRKSLRKWDEEAVQGQYSIWVEKTPRVSIWGKCH